MATETKMEILTRLVKDGHITLEEAFVLNEKEKEYVYNPPHYEWPTRQGVPPYYTDIFRVTCGSIATRNYLSLTTINN